MKVFAFKAEKFSTKEIQLGKLLELAASMPSIQVEDAIMKGAVWLQERGQGKILREYSPDKLVSPRDMITFNYDAKILQLPFLSLESPLQENANYGVWHKPAGALSQGSPFGDHASMLRAVELLKHQTIYLVHRLDRETAGIILFAYSIEGAKKLSALFEQHKVEKTYHAIVKGEIGVGTKIVLDKKLDGKHAVTHLEVILTKDGYSLVQLNPETGRFHQLRRHLESWGHPIMGDPRYGKGNKNQSGLKLMAKSLKFNDPWLKQTVHYTTEASLIF
jgi:tRNA pseudouridine32 synthase/23S rRNA pseudouridine746 synthase